MKKFKTLDETAQYVLSLGEGDLKVAAPLGLGKPNHLINHIYDLFKKNQHPKVVGRKLEIYSALSLDLPATKTELEKNLLQPFFDRHFGADYPRLQYVQDLQKKTVPANIQAYEFYFQAGQFSQVAKAQQNYISLNYTHAGRALADRGLQMILQLVAKRERDGKEIYSLSCNPDMTLDLVDLYKKKNAKMRVIGVVHPDLPFLGGDAEVPADFFEAILDGPETQHQLFALPRNDISEADHMIGLHASQMIEDDGTLQIGIGSLSEALVHAVLLRHQDNSLYQKIIERFWTGRPRPAGLHQGLFHRGLYATSEMLMDGFMHLRRAGILKRFIFDEDENKKRYLHGAFFLGSKELYQWLRQLNGEDYSGLSMTRVSKVNDLYDPHEMSLRRQRKKARFFNTCMQVNLLGAAYSDTLENGRVISGVGGQYNFVAMSQELPDSHSVLMLRSTRHQDGRRVSNIVSQNGQVTIPRHLRDVVVTEYGVAFLRGRSDEEVIQALLVISDSEFQPELIAWAKKNKKLREDYELPSWAKKNTPDQIKSFISSFRNEKVFATYPFGSEFDAVEQRLVRALGALKEKTKFELFKIVISGIFISGRLYAAELARMKLNHVQKFSQYFGRWVVLGALKAAGK